MWIKTIEDILIKGVTTAKHTVVEIEDKLGHELIRIGRAIHAAPEKPDEKALTDSPPVPSGDAPSEQTQPNG
jgi:hypothetical protein